MRSVLNELLTGLVELLLHGVAAGGIALGRAILVRGAPAPFLVALGVRLGSQLLIALAALAGAPALV